MVEGRKAKLLFSAAFTRGQVPRFRQIEGEEFQLHEAWWSQQIGASLQSTLTAVSTLAH